MERNESVASQSEAEGFSNRSPRTSLKEVFASYAALFASVATLFCCALPSLLVLLGFGLTTVVTFFAAIPGWQNFGIYEIWLFPLSGILLALGFYFAYFGQSSAQGEICEIPEGGGESACSTATRWNRRILWFSLLLFLLALVMNWWGIGWMRSHGYFNR